MTAAAPRYEVVLLDLDGTIIDSEPGVHEAVRHALTTGFGITPTRQQLHEFMGPPLSDVLPRVFGLTAPADEQLFFELYCERYFHGSEYEFDVYPGMPSVITALHDAGVRVCLATSKPDASAVRILEHAGLLACFEFVGGSHVNGTRQDKAHVVAHTLASIGASADRHSIVMVGDRALDVEAADAHGLDSIVVTWGYAVDGELDDAGATHVAPSVETLLALLLPQAPHHT